MKILAIQNRMGIGDMVIFLPYIEAVAKKFNSQITLLVKENSKADQLIKNNEFIREIILLKRSNIKKDYHDGAIGFFRLVKEIKEYNFDEVIIFNSSLRFNLICKLAGIKKVYQYPLLEKKNQNIIMAAKDLLKKNFDLNVNNDPTIQVNEKDIENVKKKFKMNNHSKNILLGIGGSGPTKRIPAKKFIELINLCTKNYDCKFFLATGNKPEEVEIMREILDKHKDKCIPLNEMSISETLPIIKNCDLSICNDSSFSHLSAGLGKSTIVLMADTPLLYGSYSSKMHPIIPDGIDEVSHGTNGKELINPNKIFEKLTKILS